MNELEKLNNKDLITNQINFSLKSDFTPTGDQPNAIKELISGINNNEKEVGAIAVHFPISGYEINLEDFKK